jgi:hypothetical protein
MYSKSEAFNIKMETNTEVNNELTLVLNNLHTLTIFKSMFDEKQSILFYDISNTIFYDISNINAFSYKSQITIDYIGICYSNYGNYPTKKGDYFYIFLFDVSPINTDSMLMKPGFTNEISERKQSAIYQYLPCKTKSYLLYWCSDIPEYVEIELHEILKKKYPELVYVTTKVNRKKDKEKKSNEIYIYHPNIMNESINFIKNHQRKNNLLQIELQEKTKQIELQEKTKQFELQEKTKQFEIEIKEKTKQFKIEIKEKEKTKQFEIEIKEKEKTKQFEIEIKEKEKTKQIELQEKTKQFEITLKYKCT